VVIPLAGVVGAWAATLDVPEINARTVKERSRNFFIFNMIYN
jgi:hypothetical protein